MKATNRLINAVWCLEYLINEDTKEIEILKHSNDNLECYTNEKKFPQFRLIEDENRVVKKVMLRNTYKSFDGLNEANADQILEVSNPRHVFDYKMITEKREII